MKSALLSGERDLVLMNVAFCLNKMKQHTSSSNRPGVRGQVGFTEVKGTLGNAVRTGNKRRLQSFSTALSLGIESSRGHLWSTETLASFA